MVESEPDHIGGTFSLGPRVFLSGSGLARTNLVQFGSRVLYRELVKLPADLGPDQIRVNGISAGPIKTLAASGVGNFRKLMQHGAAGSPMKRNVTIEDVGNASAFLCSDLAAGITGEILHVDCGYSTVGMSFTVDDEEEVIAKR